MVKLYDHQLEALKALHTGSILWGGVGSGKSITSIAYYYICECCNMKKPKDLYIITTARKRDTHEWEGECSKYGLSINPDLNEAHVSVTIDSWNNLHKYVETSSSFFIFDEQRVVGYGAWTKSFLKITKKNNWILLSATPGDCWADYIPVFIANGFYRNKTDFCRQHAIYSYHANYPQIIGYVDDKKLRKYRNQILVGMSFERNTVQHHENVMCSYNRELYFKTMRTRFDPFTQEPIRDASGLCFTLRKIVNQDRSRLSIINNLLLKHPKAIIFYNYDYELELLRTLDIKKGEWNGHKHEPLPKGNRWIYLVQYSAGSEGWNCIETDTIIFYSSSYSYKSMIQAAGRIDRINTGYHDLYYFHLTTDSKIDLAIKRALKNKKNFNESAFASK